MSKLRLQVRIILQIFVFYFISLLLFGHRGRQKDTLTLQNEPQAQTPRNHSCTKRVDGFCVIFWGFPAQLPKLVPFSQQTKHLKSIYHCSVAVCM